MTRPDNFSLPSRLGDFEIVRLLGSGGSGQVFEASWGPRRVALKVLRSDLLPNEDERSRFYSEAQVLSELGHPGIVKILSYGALDDGRPYLVMELLEGVPLAAFAQTRPLTLPVALPLFLQIADAVSAIHRGGLIHRDLKPENVLVAGGRFAVLLDFGIAKGIDAPASTTTQEGGVRGTPAYMAPERFFGQPASVASDVYELAVLLYSMLTSALPWDSGLDPEARLNPKRPSERGADLPAALETVIMRALSTRPESRHGSADEFAAEVIAAAGALADVIKRGERETAALSSGAQRAAPSVVSSAPNATGGARSLASTDRRPRWPLAAAIAAVVLIGGAIVLAAISDESSESSEVGASAETTDEKATGPTHDEPPDAGSKLKAEATPTRTGDDSGLATAARHHPADTAVLIGLRAREIRQSAAFGEVFNQEKQREPLASGLRAMAACDIDFVDDLDWVTIGLSGGARDEADVIISGAFTRDGIEACIEKAGSSIGAGSKVIRDGPITTIADSDIAGAMIWLGDSTLMFSTRKKADNKWLEARRQGKNAALDSGELAALLAKADTMASLWLVGRADALNVGTDLEGIAVPETIIGAISVSELIKLDATLEYPDASLATSAHAALEDRFKLVTGDPLLSGLFESISAERAEASVAVSIGIGKAGTSLVASAIVEALRARKK